VKKKKFSTIFTIHFLLTMAYIDSSIRFKK